MKEGFKELQRLEKLWGEVKCLYQDIEKEGGVVNYFRKNCNLDKALLIKDFSIVCIDEGIPWGGIHLPGSGVLLEETDIEELKNKIQELKKSGIKIKGVYSHEGCGAVAKMMKDNNIEGKQDEIATQKAKELAEKLGLEYLGHIRLNEMKREKDLHNAVFIYYTNLWFNWEKGKFPRGFTISRNILNKEQALKDLELAINIAFSDHGFGEKFTKENPLYIVVLEKDEDNIEKEVENLTKNSENIRLEVIKVKD
ncbi:hypothetical protein HRbin34_00325 [bacterium HR34]|nr:hypothetical protein HRbin34_00325 [bacterium HR34]